MFTQRIDTVEANALRQPPGRYMDQIADHVLFRSLVASAVAEITQRCPSYFRNSMVNAGCHEAIVRVNEPCPAFSGFSRADLALAIGLGIQTLRDLDVSVELTDQKPDSISLLLMQSILDAYAASNAFCNLRLLEHPSSEATTTLPDGLLIRRTHSGVRYAVSGNHGRPLLIIPPIGMPLKLWRNLTADPDIDRRCHIVEGCAGSFIDGGTPNSSSMARDLAAITEVIDESDLSQIDVVSWDDGARTAIALTYQQQQRVASLTLISPTFHGALESESYPSSLEDGLLDMFQAMDSNSPPGSFLLDGLVDAPVVEAALKLRCPQRRADAVLRLPPMNFLRDLLSPLCDATSFTNYMNRIINDERYDIGRALSCVTTPIMMVLGTHDAAINTSLSRAVMKRYGNNVVQITLSGAGHHPHIMQYGYFRHILQAFHAGVLPASTARLSVEEVSSNWFSRACLDGRRPALGGAEGWGRTNSATTTLKH